MRSMKVWLIWMQDDFTWLAAAWDDEQLAENHEGWLEEVEKQREVARKNECEMRIQCVEVPGVFDLFKIPTVTAEEVNE